ncbi:hypothetical protein V1264_010880 [Littorina saxatilis]|uniref:Uncharacterized protein n=2 Tax=Littorina saxatilis TaxID=31220 RepID=A0AAN9BTJ5_9CAEN
MNLMKFKGWRRTMVVWFVCVVVVCCFSVVTGEMTSPDGPLPMSTVSPAIVGNITISPSIKVNYTLELSSSAPVVLDSTITFTAKLRMNPNNTVPEGEFHYLWLNSANHGQDRSKSNHEAKLDKTFSGMRVDPGEYLLTVIVSPKTRPREILAFGNIMFRLTRRLNGNLKVKQNLEYQRRNDTFAIDREIYFHVNITDRFSMTKSPECMYFWYNGSELIHSSEKPGFDKTFLQPCVLYLQAEATASFLELDTSLSSLLPHDKEPKYGTFQEKLLFKASLSNCTVSRVDSSTDDQSVKLGDAIILNIACNGSSPSAVCWNVTGLNMTLNETCKPPSQFLNTTQHQVSVSIGQTGWSTVQLAVFNDISVHVLSQLNYYVYDADTVDIPALVFPIVFIVIGITIAAAGGAYIVRLRRRLHVEVADFDFDPNISVRTTNILSPVAAAVKHIIGRLRRWRDQSNRNSHSDQPGMRRSQSLYESL